MTLAERIKHWPSTAEGVMWGGVFYAVIHYICPELKPLDSTTFLALIPIVRGALAAPAPAVASTVGVEVKQVK